MSAEHRDARLAALVVNYNSGPFALRCVESLQAAWAHEGRAANDLEIVVVDNASPLDQEPWLAQTEERGAVVIRHDRNDGYAAGMNLAYARTSGGPRDVVAVLNPDLFFPPGEIGKLIDYVLEHDDCGVVGPRAFIDEEKVLHLPRNPLPTLRDWFRTFMSQLSTTMCRDYSRRRVAAALPWWRDRAPIDCDMLSGCCLVLRREVVDELPALMDERYPLYFEDSDLCRELVRRGYRVVFHGGVEILHHWSRSCGPSGGIDNEPMVRGLAGRRLYFEKFYGKTGRIVTDVLTQVMGAWPKKLSYRPMHVIEDIGGFDAPVELPLPGGSEYLLELTMAPSWTLAVGIFASGDRWVCPEATWNWFFQAQYFVRALDLETGDVIGAWCFHKTTPGRESPLELETYSEYVSSPAREALS